jgi:hypothetical protein
MNKNLKKFTAEKIFHCRDKKNCNLLVPMPPYRSSKLQEKPSALKKEHPAHVISKLFVILWLIFAPLDLDSIWIPVFVA